MKWVDRHCTLKSCCMTTKIARSALPRRAALVCAAAASIRWPTARPAMAAMDLSSRLDATSLTPPLGTESMPGDLRYPAWLAGTWRVTNRGDGFSMPLGPRFVDPELVAEARKAVRLQYGARFTKAPLLAGWPSLSVRQDRRFNEMQEEGAFISSGGFVVERGTYACDDAHPHGTVLLDVLDTDVAGQGLLRSAANGAVDVRPTFRFKTAVDILWASWELTDDAFTTSELTVQRQLVPGANGKSEEVDVTFLELLTRYERPASDQPRVVRARYRVVQYLNLNIPGVAAPVAVTRAARELEKKAAGQAISILDYDLLMEAVGEDAGSEGS